MSFPFIKGTHIRLQSSDILTFSNISIKAKNDEYNKIRECIIANIADIPDFPIEDTYIEQWSIIYILTMNLLEEICGTTNFSIIQKAGRKNNNDFELISNNDTNLKTNMTYLLEFKSNNIPQIVSIYCNNKIVSNLDYASYFYDNYLIHILRDKIPIISREEYLRDIYKTKPSLTENENFFQYLKDNIGSLPIINESITLFLEKNVMKFNLDIISNYLDHNLTNKIIILWDCNKMEYSILKKINSNDVKLLKIEPNIFNNNTVIIYSETIKFKFLLRWKNHKGCLGPAWQVSYQYLT
jgi:hypothetical protein